MVGAGILSVSSFLGACAAPGDRQVGVLFHRVFEKLNGSSYMPRAKHSQKLLLFRTSAPALFTSMGHIQAHCLQTQTILLPPLMRTFMCTVTQSPLTLLLLILMSLFLLL